MLCVGLLVASPAALQIKPSGRPVRIGQGAPIQGGVENWAVRGAAQRQALRESIVCEDIAVETDQPEEEAQAEVVVPAAEDVPPTPPVVPLTPAAQSAPSQWTSKYSASERVTQRLEAASPAEGAARSMGVQPTGGRVAAATTRSPADEIRLRGPPTWTARRATERMELREPAEAPIGVARVGLSGSVGAPAASPGEESKLKVGPPQWRARSAEERMQLREQTDAAPVGVARVGLSGSIGKPAASPGEESKLKMAPPQIIARSAEERRALRAEEKEAEE